MEPGGLGRIPYRAISWMILNLWRARQDSIVLALSESEARLDPGVPTASFVA